MQGGQAGRNISELEPLPLKKTRENKDSAPSSGKDQHNQPTDTQLVNPFTNCITKSNDHDLKLKKCDCVLDSA